MYFICTLSNKLRCKQRVIAEKGKPYSIRFKGQGHNHGLDEYYPCSAKPSAMKISKYESLKSPEIIVEEQK